MSSGGHSISSSDAQAAHPHVPHAATRAFQRYGIVLSPLDLRDLAKRCLDGEGKMETKPDGVAYHALIVGQQILWLVYRSPCHGSPLRHGTVVTIMPPEIGKARAYRDHKHMQRRKRQQGRW